jgi:uncharacterized membrane protein (UPF0127 family)
LIKRSILLMTLAVIVAGCAGSPECSPSRGRLVLGRDTGGVTLDVQIASTPQEQTRGLMGRTSLGEDDGLAYVFESASTASFWMKDTTIPLSVAFWDAHGRITGVLDMAPCRADPCHRYRSSVPYMGAVEANRGYFERHGIGIGDRVRLDEPACG